MKYDKIKVNITRIGTEAQRGRKQGSHQFTWTRGRCVCGELIQFALSWPSPGSAHRMSFESHPEIPHMPWGRPCHGPRARAH